MTFNPKFFGEVERKKEAASRCPLRRGRACGQGKGFYDFKTL